MIKFLKVKKGSDKGDYHNEIEFNDQDLHSLLGYLNFEIYYSESFEEWEQLLDSEKDFDDYTGMSLIGLAKKYNQIYVIFENSNSPEYYYTFNTTIEKMRKIIESWIDIARTKWELPDGKIMDLPDEILITDEDGEVTITRTDGFDPYDTSKGTPKPCARLVFWK